MALNQNRALHAILCVLRGVLNNKTGYQDLQITKISPTRHLIASLTRYLALWLQLCPKSQTRVRTPLSRSHGNQSLNQQINPEKNPKPLLKGKQTQISPLRRLIAPLTRSRGSLSQSTPNQKERVRTPLRASNAINALKPP